MTRTSLVVCGEAFAQVIGQADIRLFWKIDALEKIDVFHFANLARLRPSGYDGQPSLASRTEFAASPFAKVGGARRDRTADLLHAMQALSQLSYGPFREQGSGISDQVSGKDYFLIPDT